MATQLLDLARRLGVALDLRGLVLSTAESCTAGGVAYAITQVPGSSRWFDAGLVVYANAAKRRLLGVSAQDLRRHGAVSEAVACAMVRGALGTGRARAALAVTGIAGPDGGSVDKPVGTVWFAWALRSGRAPARLQARRCHFDGDRAAVRTQAIAQALAGMIDMLDKETP